MRRVLFITILATLLTACTAEFTEHIAPLSPKTLTVTFDEESRILLDENSQTVWTADDKVSVFYRSYVNECWKYAGATGSTSGPLVNQGESSVETTSRIVAVYPYNESYTLSDSSLSLTIPQTQSYAVGSYGLNDNIMVAVTQNYDLAFRNLFGYLRLSLSGDKSIKSIKINGNNNEIIAGAASIDLQSLGMTFNNSSSTSITIDCGDGVQLTEAPKSFHFAIAPQNFTKGITITILCSDGEQIVKSTSKSVNIVRNHILPMATLDYCSLCSTTPLLSYTKRQTAIAGQTTQTGVAQSLYLHGMV